MLLDMIGPSALMRGGACAWFGIDSITSAQQAIVGKEGESGMLASRLLAGSRLGDGWKMAAIRTLFSRLVFFSLKE